MIKPASDSQPLPFERRVEALRAELRLAQPLQLAAHTHTVYSPAEGFHLTLWERPHRLSFPELIVYKPSGAEASPSIQALVLYYYLTADGAPLSERWVSLAELPDGRFYNQAYQGYRGRKLSLAFGNRLEALAQAVQAQGGEAFRPPGAEEAPGDAAFHFQAFPRLPLLLVYWLGDEEFPASAQVLFDASASHYLPTDVCAILGGMLTGRLIATQADKHP